MTKSESHLIELEELAPWSDAQTVLDDGWQITEADIRELSAYGFDSDDQTLVGIGSSRSSASSTTDRFVSTDRTLVGLGPVERAERASRAREAEEAPESAQVPPSESPGPFIASDDEDVRPALPMQRGWLWALAVPAVLAAAAAVAVVRDVVPRASLGHAAMPAPVQAAAALHAPSPAVEVRAPLPAEPTPVALSPVVALQKPSTELAPAAVTKKPDNASTPRGALDISSNPPASVVLDGRPLGKAPRVVEIAPGPHTVVFVHPERGRMSVSVNVSAGRTTNASANF